MKNCVMDVPGEELPVTVQVGPTSRKSSDRLVDKLETLIGVLTEYNIDRRETEVTDSEGEQERTPSYYKYVKEINRKRKKEPTMNSRLWNWTETEIQLPKKKTKTRVVLGLVPKAEEYGGDEVDEEEEAVKEAEELVNRIGRIRLLERYVSLWTQRLIYVAAARFAE